MNDLDFLYEEVFCIDDFIEESENLDKKSSKGKLLLKISIGIAVASTILVVARKLYKDSNKKTAKKGRSNSSSNHTQKKSTSDYYYSEFKKDVEKDIKILKEARTYLKNVNLEDEDKKSKLEEQNKKVDKALKRIGETWKEFFNKHKTELIDSGYYKEMQQKIMRIGFNGISVFDNNSMYDYQEYFK